MVGSSRYAISLAAVHGVSGQAEVADAPSERVAEALMTVAPRTPNAARVRMWQQARKGELLSTRAAHQRTTTQCGWLSRNDDDFLSHNLCYIRCIDTGRDFQEANLVTIPFILPRPPGFFYPELHASSSVTTPTSLC